MRSKKIIIIIIILAIVLGLGVYMIISSNTDGNKFKEEYELYNNLTYKEEGKNKSYERLDIDKDNPIIYLTDETVIESFNTENKLIFLGFPDDNDSRKGIEVLLEVAEDNGIEEIYYYDVKGIKDKKDIYEEILEMTNRKEIKTPYLGLIKNKKLENYQSGLIDDLYDKYEEIIIDYIMCTADC